MFVIWYCDTSGDSSGVTLQAIVIRWLAYHSLKACMCASSETGYCEWQWPAPPMAPGNALRGLNCYCGCSILRAVPILHWNFRSLLHSWNKRNRIWNFSTMCRIVSVRAGWGVLFRRSYLRLKLHSFEIMLKHCSEVVCILVLRAAQPAPLLATDVSNADRVFLR